MSFVAFASLFTLLTLATVTVTIHCKKPATLGLVLVAYPIIMIASTVLWPVPSVLQQHKAAIASYKAAMKTHWVKYYGFRTEGCDIAAHVDALHLIKPGYFPKEEVTVCLWQSKYNLSKIVRGASADLLILAHGQIKDGDTHIEGDISYSQLQELAIANRSLNLAILSCRGTSAMGEELDRVRWEGTLKQIAQATKRLVHSEVTPKKEGALWVFAPSGKLLKANLKEQFKAWKALTK